MIQSTLTSESLKRNASTGTKKSEGSEIPRHTGGPWVASFSVVARKANAKETDVHDKHPTNNYYAYKTLISKLKGFESVTKLTGDQYKFTFANKSPVYVFWCDSGQCPISTQISGILKTTDYLGNEMMVDASQITLTVSPIFLE